MTSRRRRLTQQVQAVLTQFNKWYGRERWLIKHWLLLPVMWRWYGHKSSSAAFCSITWKGNAGQGTERWLDSAPFVCAERGGFKLDKDINGSKTRCDLGQATSLLALLRAGTELSPVRCPQQQGSTLDSLCVAVIVTTWCPPRDNSAPRNRGVWRERWQCDSLVAASVQSLGESQTSPSYLHGTPCGARDGGLGSFAQLW